MIIQGATIYGTSIYDQIDLFPFSTFTFTPAGMIGATGPNLGNCYGTYSNVGNTWLQNTDYFAVPVQGYQTWTVPGTGTYEIEAGGSRSSINIYASNSYSFGATVRGRFNLNRGDKITIVVGQFTANTTNNGSYNGAGGGGGSFVVLGNVLTGANTITMANATPLIIAGGGGGTGRWVSWLAGSIILGSNGATTTSGVASTQGAAPGTNGWGGNSHVAANLMASSNGYDSGGGGGFYNGGVNGVGGNVRTNATNGSTGGGGQAFANLAVGGVVSSTYATTGSAGGFGGGGGGTPICGGGGGGYSGGGGGWAGSATTAADGGGGGGSYINANVVSVVATSTGTYEGSATLNGISISTIGYNTNIGYVRITRV